MPEGHTIHRMARDHLRWLSGGPVRASSPQGRFVEGAEALDGRALEGTEAWGKHLFHRYEGGVVLHLHMGLFGRARMARSPMPEPRGAIRLRLEGPHRGVDIRGATTVALIEDPAAVFARLGPDPLRPDADPELAWAALQRRRCGVGAALMDQKVLAGIGNIYRTELLWLEHIHPLRPCAELARGEFDALWDRARELLQLGVRTNRIITVPLQGRDPRKLRRGERQNIFKKPHCPRCGDPIEELEIRTRRAFVCPGCQT